MAMGIEHVFWQADPAEWPTAHELLPCPKIQSGFVAVIEEFDLESVDGLCHPTGSVVGPGFRTDASMSLPMTRAAS